MIVVAAELDPSDLLARCARHVPPAWATSVLPTSWGAVLVSGAEPGRCGDWLVAGRPSLHPWGVPGWPQAPEIVARAFDELGAVAAHLAAGPHVAVDLEGVSVVAALNGIVPVWVSIGSPWVAGTSLDCVGSAAGGEVERIAPGWSTGPSGPAAVAALDVAEQLPGIDGESLDRERRAIVAADRRGVTTDVLWDPDLATADFTSLRLDGVPAAWWRARLAGCWIHAPAFERPALDLAALGGLV